MSGRAQAYTPAKPKTLSVPTARKSSSEAACNDRVALSAVPPIVHEVINAPGRLLDAATRADMEPRFGHDFSRVRIYTDAKAAESAQAINARAYTLGGGIVFGRGQYAPETIEGRRLLAHELTHAAQQSPTSTNGDLRLGDENSALEAEAETRSNDVVKDLPVSKKPISSLFSAGTVQRLAITPLGQGGGIGGLLERDRERTRGQRNTLTFSLTFDDGPHTSTLGENNTEKVLDTLRKKMIKAGFFIQTGIAYRGASQIGRQLVARMHAEGHKVGIHTGGKTDHELHTKGAAAGRLTTELEAAKQYISDTTQETPTLVRPPEGKLDQAVLATYVKANLTNLLWDIDGDQGKDLPLSTLVRRAWEGVYHIKRQGWKSKTGSSHIVVLYHDIKKGTAENIGTLADEIVKTTSALSGGKYDVRFDPP